jgi:hypothetical protein
LVVGAYGAVAAVSVRFLRPNGVAGKGEIMGSYSEHKCDVNGAPVSATDGPQWADPRGVVQFPDVQMFGRVRLIWRCCGARLVECMTFPDDPERAETHTVRATLTELAEVEWGTSYSVPCVGAAWSLHLPCGHIAGEGCDCDTIAAEAAQI